MQPRKAVKVLVVTGSSGGHIFPALSFIDELIEKDRTIDALLVLPKKSVREETLPESCKVKHVSISTIRLSLGLGNLIALFNFLKGSFESLFLVLEYRPDVVVGFGSLNSIPLVLLGWLLRTRTLIHEQNVIPGRANRFLANFADKIALSFAQTKDFLKVSPEKIVITGNPLRRRLKKINRQEALRFFGFNEDKFTILVAGGSQGSHRINMCFLEALSKLSGHAKFQVVHLCGAKDFDLLMEKYEDLDLKFKLFAFLKEMQYAYSAADLVISRAGATTTAELLFFELPAIIIPYPYAYAHQVNNAQVLEGLKVAKIIRDDELDANNLRDTLVDLINNQDKIRLMRQNFSLNPKTDANALLVKEALNA